MSKVIEYSNQQLRQLQLVELEMLIEFDRICRKYGIQYSLDGGTLLGAIRHKGFIPWDDDVDVMMTKEEYEKFYKVCDTDLDKSRFFFQDYRTDEEYRWGYGKIRRIGTEYIKAGHENAHYKTGVCIDVFGFENLPDGKIKRRFYMAKMYCIRKILYSEIGRTNANNAFLRTWYKLLYLIPKNTVFRIKNRMYSKLSKIRTENIINIMLPFKKKACRFGYPRSFFDRFIEVEFEGMKFSAIADYDNFLKMKYGDYMKIPPKEKQKGVMNASKLELIDISLDDLKAEYARGKSEYQK